MKRKTNKPSYGIFARKYDPEKVVGEHVLRTLGEIVILWNNIEYELDETLEEASGLPKDVATSIRSRISGLEAKADILKESLEPMLYFTGAERKLLADTLGDFMVLKGYRDNLVHMRLQGHPRKIQAFTPEKRGARYEIPYSPRLLTAVASRLRLFKYEMRLFRWLIFWRIWIINSEKTRLPYKPERMREAAEHRARKDWKSLQAYRKRRLALRPLPEFREEDPPPPQWEEMSRSDKRQHAESMITAARDAVDRKIARRMK